MTTQDIIRQYIITNIHQTGPLVQAELRNGEGDLLVQGPLDYIVKVVEGSIKMAKEYAKNNPL